MPKIFPCALPSHALHPPPQVLECPPNTELVFYGPQALLVEASVEPADASTAAQAAATGCSQACDAPALSGDSGSDSEGEACAGLAAAAAEEPQGFGAASVLRRGGLKPAKELRLRCPVEGGRRPLKDVAVSGVPGWVAVHAGSGGAGGVVSLRVWTPPGVEVFSRPPLPVPSPLGDEQPEPVAVASPARQQRPRSGGAAQGRQRGGAAADTPDWW